MTVSETCATCLWRHSWRLTVGDDEAAQHEAIGNVDEGSHVAQHHSSADGRGRSKNGDGCLVN